jgi:DNA-binding transcriptional LysR family regulator
MLDAVSLDQMRAFVAAYDEGSFSAAARKLRRAQSVISELIGTLEGQVGVKLFDRSRRYPALTNAGIVLLADARNILAGVDAMKARAKNISAGLEPELSVVVDALFPMAAVILAAQEFKATFTGTPLRLFVEALGATHQRVADETASVGIAASLANSPTTLTAEHLCNVSFVMVAGRHHPLSAVGGIITKAELANHIQLVLTDRSTLTGGVEYGVVSSSPWRLADLSTKREFLLQGLGWGGMPYHAVQQDLASGALVELDIAHTTDASSIVPMSAIYQTTNPPGPAGRWFINSLAKHANMEMIHPL